MIMLRPGFKIGILAGLTLVGATACGGAGSTMPDENSISAPVPAAAAKGGDALDVPVQQQLPETTISTPTDPVGSDADAIQSASLAQQELLSNAANVGCEAAPEVFNATMLALVNESRSEARMCVDTSHDAVPALAWNDQLAQAAVAHSLDMASNNFFSHDGSDGLNVADRVDAANYPWRAVGENIAAGQLDNAEVHQGWIESPGHCRNIMNDIFSEVGAACVRDSATDFGTYWVVVFGDSR